MYYFLGAPPPFSNLQSGYSLQRLLSGDNLGNAKAKRSLDKGQLIAFGRRGQPGFEFLINFKRDYENACLTACFELMYRIMNQVKNEGGNRHDGSTVLDKYTKAVKYVKADQKNSYSASSV